MAHTLFYTRGSGNSFKPALVLRQTGRSLAMRHVDVLSGESRRPDFLAINRRGQVPYLITDGGCGIGESNAIAWFLAEQSDLIPGDALSRAQALQWMIFEQTSLEPNISPARFFTTILPSGRDAHAADFPRWLEAGTAALQVLDEHLLARDFITDHGYSVADIAVFGYTHLAREGGFDLDRWRGVARWMERVQNTPDYAAINELLAA